MTEINDIKMEFDKTVKTLYDFCDYSAVRYKILFSLFGYPYNHPALEEIRPDYMSSDIVKQLYSEQGIHGNWGKFRSKDYSAKTVFPTTSVAINRCLYIGLTLSDGDILLNAMNFLEDFYYGKSEEKYHNSNERDIPWQRADVCELIESIQPYSNICDDCFNDWLYIAESAFYKGEYSYEREARAQHEVFGTREDRLVPLRNSLLLKRREELTSGLEEAMLRHYGAHVFENGHFWNNCPKNLPDIFKNNKMRRWMFSFNYINMFRNSSVFLKDSVEWLFEQKDKSGLWDWGTQTKDPWGYFGYFSLNKNYTHNRIVDCNIEILSFIKKYIDNNSEIDN